MGSIYLCFMMVGAAIVRVPPPGWAPAGLHRAGAAQTAGHDPERIRLRGAEDAAVLADLVGPVPQCDRRDRRAGAGLGDEPGDVPRADHPVAASGFVGLFSLFNMAGRFFWSSTSDYIGRKNTYFVFFALGTVLYALVPTAGAIHSVALFVLCYAVIFSMYGGGFATVPAYLRDMFGTPLCRRDPRNVVDAWSMAGIFGPVLVNYIREYNVTHGVAPAQQAYNVTM